VLRSRLEPLSSPELVRLRDELRSEAGAEGQAQRRREGLDDRIAHSEELLAGVEAERRALGAEPRRGRARQEHREAARLLDTRESMSREALARHEAERVGLPPVAHDARAEVAVIDRILDRRVELALAAARVSPAEHLVAELRERPEEGAGRLAWDRAVREIEAYRQRNGVVDRDGALGPVPEDRAQRREREQAQQSIRRAQRELAIEPTQRIERTPALEVEL
jgi:hypothetical protein